MKKILVTGAAGYVGSTLVRQLLEKNYNVVGYDNLSFGGESLISVLNHPNFKFVRGDLRNVDLLEKTLSETDAVVHLAAIVGDPACAKDPELAIEVNLKSTIRLINSSINKNIDRFVFVSTCSNYGKMSEEENYVCEKSILAPVSLYAKSKVQVEEYILNKIQRESNFNPTILRFATAYGLSPRPRFDLTVNEFVKELALQRKLIVFGEQFWRPYCHVEDLARAIILVLNSEKEKVAYSVYNVGKTSENYQKSMIIEEINKFIADLNIEYVKKDEDPRNYKVSFEKINNHLDFKTTKTVPDGIDEIYNLIRQGFVINPDDLKYRNS